MRGELLLAVQAYNLRSKVPTQTHQLPYLTSRTSFSDTFMSYKKHGSIETKHFTFSELFTSLAKISSL